MKTEVWTSREVHFEPFPRAMDKYEDLMEILADHYYDPKRAAWKSRLFEPGIGAASGTVEVSGIPWWVPKPVARRWLARWAVRAGIEGNIYFITETAVLRYDY